MSLQVSECNNCNGRKNTWRLGGNVDPRFTSIRQQSTTSDHIREYLRGTMEYVHNTVQNSILYGIQRGIKMRGVCDLMRHVHKSTLYKGIENMCVYSKGISSTSAPHRTYYIIPYFRANVQCFRRIYEASVYAYWPLYTRGNACRGGGGLVHACSSI